MQTRLLCSVLTGLVLSCAHGPPAHVGVAGLDLRYSWPPAKAAARTVYFVVDRAGIPDKVTIEAAEVSANPMHLPRKVASIGLSGLHRYLINDVQTVLRRHFAKVEVVPQAPASLPKDALVARVGFDEAKINVEYVEVTESNVSYSVSSRQASTTEGGKHETAAGMRDRSVASGYSPGAAMYARRAFAYVSFSIRFVAEGAHCAMHPNGRSSPGERDLGDAKAQLREAFEKAMHSFDGAMQPERLCIISEEEDEAFREEIRRDLRPENYREPE